MLQLLVEVSFWEATDIHC